ncbi:hypothetical protein AGMMS49525_08910 [Bacteroidia bacterium]|nr:hypothetical protein AGMMS49525_08910 [Bacteroidia bacterium]
MQNAANNFIDILHANTDHFPEATTSDVASIGRKSATFYGNITSVGNPKYTERGFCYSTSQNPTISDTKVVASYSGNTGNYSYTVNNGLTAGTTYYVRAYATGSLGTIYGNQVTFTTVAPIVITFNAQGGSAVASQTVDNEWDTTTQPADPIRNGYTFDGWYQAADYINKWNFSNGVSGSMTLYAKWLVDVTFNSQGGSTIDPQSATADATINQPADPTRAGYSFDGWYTNAACTTAWNFDNDVVANDITLYAKWTSGSSVIQSALVEQFAVYPNPAKETVTIKNASGKTVSIFNTSGSKVFEKEVQSNEEQITVFSWVQGTPDFVIT